MGIQERKEVRMRDNKKKVFPNEIKIETNGDKHKNSRALD